VTQLQSLITRLEGRRLLAYDDATGKPIQRGSVVRGHPTIGDGFALDTAGLDDEECDWLRDRRIKRCEQFAVANFPFFLNLCDARQAVIVSMIYNLGPLGFMQFRLTIGHFAAGRFADAAREMENSVWALQVPERARELAAMVRTGNWPTPR